MEVLLVPCNRSMVLNRQDEVSQLGDNDMLGHQSQGTQGIQEQDSQGSEGNQGTWLRKYALTPAHAGFTNPLNFDLLQHPKLWMKGSEPLDQMFNLQPCNFPLFTSMLQDKGFNYGWDHIFDITIPIDSTNYVNWFESWGTILVGQIHAYATTFINTPC